jgi:hypothetical protein
MKMATLSFATIHNICAAAVMASILCLSTLGAQSLPQDVAAPRTRDPIDLPERSSSIVVPVTVSLADLQTAANKQIPITLYSIDQNQDACVPAQWINTCVLPRIWPAHGCAQYLKTKATPAIDCHLDGQITRRNVTVGGSGTTLALSVPIDISVTASGRGAIGKNIHQTASANMVASAAASLDVNENWEPKANINANYSWTDPPHVWILGFKITFADKVDPTIRDLIAQLQQNLPGLLAYLKLKDIVDKYWQSGFTTLQVSGTPPVWISLHPESVGYGGYRIGNGELDLTFMAGGKLTTSIGTKPNNPTPSPLPNLQKTLPTPGFDLSAPISADYATLHDQLATGLKFGQEQSFDLQGYGHVKAKINDVVLYQTTDKNLAIGISLDASPPVGFAAAKGTVWLTTKIKIDNAAQIISPDTLLIYGKEGNGPLDLIVSLIQFTPLKDVVRSSLAYTYTHKYDELLANINATLRRQLTPQLYTEGKVDKVTPETVVAGPNALTAIVDAHGMIAIHSGVLPK